MGENDDLLPEFLIEAFELLEKVYQDLASLSSTSNPQPLLDGMFRNIHTIKGGSSMFNFSNTKEVAHQLESFLSNLKSSEGISKISEEQVEFIREETQKIEVLLKNKDQINTEEESEQESASASPAAASNDNNTLLDYIRVPVQRINESMNGIAEIFLIRNQLVHLMERQKSGLIDQRDFYQNWDQLDSALRRGIGELERSTMNMRMAPVGGLFSRMERVVQSYKVEGKKIEFITKGETTELDKKVLDTLAEPLIHLVRNAMDHGIEKSEDRTQKGKHPEGKITLNAFIVGNEAVIEITDDGKGIDPNVILSSAKEKGIDTSHVADDKSAIDLIFLPGFSTAKTVSEISGRGVGMDAVRTSVNSLGGKVQIQSKVGTGSVFTIRLPVSVSVSPVVIVNIKGLKYAIPNNDILEIRQTSIQNVSTNTGKQYISFRNSFTECVDLRKTIAQGVNDFEENMSEASLLFFKCDEKIFAARVSSFENNTEIIVKPTSSLLPVVPWISGVSVLPTGEAIFVISLSHIFEKSQLEVVNAA